MSLRIEVAAVRRSTRQTNRQAAKAMEASFRTALAKGEAGLLDRKPVPRLRDFALKFTEAIRVRCAAKPRTVQFYVEKLTRLLEFEQLANAPLDRIEEALVENYVQYRSKKVSPASVNRELATLRRLLRIAEEWKIIVRVPRIRLLRGERSRDFVLTHPQEQLYLTTAPQPLRDAALLLIDTGLRLGEAVALEWKDVYLEPINGAKFGYICIRDGKTKNAKRNVCLTARLKAVLQKRKIESDSRWVFPGRLNKPIQGTSLDHLHAKVRKFLGLTKEFVLHSLRHTLLTRLGQSGTDAFTIMRIAGHASVTISQRYVHPTPETVERAFERLEILNSGKQENSPKLIEGKRPLTVPTIPPTLLTIESVTH